MRSLSDRESWDRRIERADQLAARDAAAGSLIAFYARLLRFQKALHRSLHEQPGSAPSGSLERDLPLLRSDVERLLAATTEDGPEPLAAEARRLTAAGPSAVDDMLLACWRSGSDRQFFARAVLQSYGQFLAESGIPPVDRALAAGENACPFCGGAPQLSVLRLRRDADGGGRELLCATCLGTWPFPRLRCACCGEDDERHLGYFHAPEFDHVRVDACDRCRHYLKTIDVGRSGVAVPVVDEVAAAALDVWAREQGYVKIHLNLLGL